LKVNPELGWAKEVRAKGYRIVNVYLTNVCREID
jgi:hypothetical protein